LRPRRRHLFAWGVLGGGLVLDGGLGAAAVGELVD